MPSYPYPVTLLPGHQDDVKAKILETEELIESCKCLSELMFSLASYQTSIAQQTLAGVATVFLPLTYLAGIYGEACHI